MDQSTARKRVSLDEANLLDRLVSMLDDEGVRYCVIDGQAVNAYVEPLVNLDLDVVVAACPFLNVSSGAPLIQ